MHLFAHCHQARPLRHPLRIPHRLISQIHAHLLVWQRARSLQLFSALISLVEWRISLRHHPHPLSLPTDSVRTFVSIQLLPALEAQLPSLLSLLPTPLHRHRPHIAPQPPQLLLSRSRCMRHNIPTIIRGTTLARLPRL